MCPISRNARLFDRRIFRQKLSDRLKRNSIFAGGQALISIVSMFLAYRVLIQEVGVERFGLWSLMIAGGSIARVADVTGAGGLARFVAEAKSDGRDTVIYVHTVVLSTLALYSALSAIFFIHGEYALLRFIDTQMIDEALSLLPLAIIVSLLMMPLAVTLTSAIDGVGRADQRAILGILSNLLFLGGVFLFVPYFGVWAWGCAIILQQAFIIFGAWVLLMKHIPSLGILPTKWSIRVLGETIPYGMKLQVNSVAMMLSDPIAKFALHHYGGLTSVGIYEVASKLVVALRSLAVQMAMPLVPEFASIRHNVAQARDLLRQSGGFTFLFATAMLVVLMPIAPIYSVIIFHELNRELILIITALAIGYFVNILAIPYYFAGMGLNFLRWNIGSQFSMAVSILTIGVLLGDEFGKWGILFSIALGATFGGGLVIFGNSRYLMRLEVKQK